MPFGTGRLCNCNNDFCLKSPLCDYNPLLKRFDSSSGIDKNPYELKEELKENFKNIKNMDNHSNSIIYFIIFIIFGLIILSIYKK